MSIEDHTDEDDVSAQTAPLVRAQDDFVFRAQIHRSETAEIPSERRMHLRAFDYWHGLNAGRPLPHFEDLTAEGLTPFRQNCLLLEYHKNDMLVRFCGSSLAALLGSVLAPGTQLSSASPTSFSKALLQRLSTEEGRQEAAEFEFVDHPLECRGTFLPFSARGEMAEFVMVVVNHRHKPAASSHAAVATENDTEDGAVFAALAKACSDAGAAVVHPGAGTREGLYSALAKAYQLHITAAKNQTAYVKFLRQQGMRQQSRAPFTPALKLTFGKDYDKTRLTEYAAALSCAARNEIGPDGLSDFLKSHPGGIKGCVQEERARRQGKTADQKRMAVEAARAMARQMPPILLENAKLDKEFGLVLVRRTDDGSIELISTVNSPQHVIDKAIFQIAPKDKN